VCNHMPVNLTFMVYEIIDYQTSWSLDKIWENNE
jgi:hypothetical protein